MKKLILVALCAALAACATSQSELSAALPRYQGKSVDLVLQRWGQPSRTAKGVGGFVLIWENAAPARDCRVEAHIDEQRNVMGLRGTGTEGACSIWMRMLN